MSKLKQHCHSEGSEESQIVFGDDKVNPEMFRFAQHDSMTGKFYWRFWLFRYELWHG